MGWGQDVVLKLLSPPDSVSSEQETIAALGYFLAFDSGDRDRLPELSTGVQDIALTQKLYLSPLPQT